tara:strand:+ start:697 stop:1050 length:354 start_codon:yes stop_codon:yes gene_type:complete
MGYRSEVAIALTSDAARKLLVLQDFCPELKQLINDADDTLHFDKESINQGYDIKLYWNHIKWYDSYTEIQQMEAFLYNILSDDCEYLLLRVGEDTEDMETQGHYWESDMYIQRSISL